MSSRPEVVGFKEVVCHSDPIGGVSATDILSSAVWLLAAAKTGPRANGELHKRCSGNTGARG